MDKGFLFLEDGTYFEGRWHGGSNRAGEVVFNTSHNGYEEIATDPSYFRQIVLMTAPMQGNYGASTEFWESDKINIEGFLSLEIQDSHRDRSWMLRLLEAQIPILTEFDTRKLTLYLREKGTCWGSLIKAESSIAARSEALRLIEVAKAHSKDWAFEVSTPSAYEIKGDKNNGIRVAVLDFGLKKNILRELKDRCSIVKVFPSRASFEEIMQFQPNGVLLSNGPGDPGDVETAVETIKKLLGQVFIFGICMGHQLLGLALGAKTYRLQFGHRGSNHPIRDKILDKVYMTSQNHGYAIDAETIPSDVEITHINLNDQTVSGIRCLNKKCFSVQFHPESHPGPREAVELFDTFIRNLL